MAGGVRIISGPRNKSFDHYIEDIIGRGGWEIEHDYFGIQDEDGADFIRRKMRTAGRHMNPPVAVKAFWKPCPGVDKGCELGGPECRYHVKFTVYNMELARKFKEKVQTSARRAI
jgi:hypothetical protein